MRNYLAREVTGCGEESRKWGLMYGKGRDFSLFPCLQTM